jgi:eukaryotic-like serine/threonine-protein kinase
MERIGPYEILGRIGRGGSADILLAERNGKRVAIKRLHEHLAEDEIFVRMFLDEARVMSLLPHENIVHVFDLGEDGGTCYTAMELVDGPALSAVVKLAGALPVDVLCAIGACVADALAFVHAARDPASGVPLDLVHRDVAAPNILLSREGDVKLTDFGVVRSRTARTLGILSSETTKGGVLKGRKSTMSPEQVLGKAIDARADLFSLGVVLWECATGRKLWDAGALDVVDQIVNSPAPPLDAALPIAPLVAQLLAKDRDKRPTTASDVAARLRVHAAPRKSIAKLVQSLNVPSLR